MLQASPQANVYQLQPTELLSGLREVIRESNLVYRYQDVSELMSNHLEKVVKETERRLTEVEVAAHAARLYNKIASRAVKQGLSALSEYQSGRKRMCFDDFMDEKHNSKRLGRFMKCTGEARPTNVSAHAIVSGKHEAARGTRFVLAKWRIRIDDPDNGVFLPRDSRYMPHPDFPKAVNHAALHSDCYYLNITPMLEPVSSEEECRLILRLIAKMLTDGSFEY